MPKVGAHVSAAVSLERSFDKALEIGAACTQIFISPPQQWAQTFHDKEEIERYRGKEKKAGIGPNFVHGTYLINLATQDSQNLQKSVDWLIWAMNLAGQLGMEGVIFHIGSHGGAGFEKVSDQICTSLEKIFTRCQPKPPSRWSKLTHYLILENSAGMGGSIGSKFSELGQIIKVIKDPRLKICLDTQHSFAAGYDIKTPTGLKSTLEEFEEEIGLGNLVAVHCNDSKVALGGGKDRHENIGEGFIGREGFKNLINHKALKDIPFILEVPGFSDNGPDRENIEILKLLIKD